MRRLAERVGTLTGWRRGLAAFVCGGLSVLALAPFNLWPVLFLTLPTFVWLLDGACDGAHETWRARSRRAFATGWAFGFGYFVFGLYWIGNAFLVEAEIFAFLMPIAMTILPAGLALFHAAAAVLVAALWHPGLPRLFVFAAAFALADWLRSHILTGFPWNLFGHVFAGEAGLSQLFALVGPHALSFVALVAFASPALIADAPARAPLLRRTLAPLVALLLLATGSLWGHMRLAGAANDVTPEIRLRIVQPNVEQRDKWKPGNAGPIYRLMLELSGQATAERPGGLDGVSHLIWPESALPFFVDRAQEALDGIAGLLPDTAFLITGAERYETVDDADGNAGYVFYNGLAVLDGRAAIVARFDKKHLVPFGEYLPLRPWLEAIGLQQLTHIRGGFAAGTAPRLVRAGTAPAFAPLVCYEVIFPGEVVEPGERPGWLLNVTNDAWYGVSTGPYQHLAQARLRAIETGLPLVRAANTGISAVIDPYGRIVRSLPLATQGIIDADLPLAIAPPLYATIGDLIFIILIVIVFALGAMARKTTTD